MKSIKIFAVVTLISAYSLAIGFGLEGGFRQQSGDAPAGMSTSSEVGFTLGATGIFDLTEMLALRSGVMYTQRPLKVTNDITKDSATVTLTYFDIPIGLMVKFEDWMGVYAGIALSLNLDKNSNNSNVVQLRDVKSMVTPVQLGVTFKFLPEMGLNLYFEQFGDVADGLKSYRSVGANLLFTME
ncbi:MAG: outer membrane beta-barrel protein [Bdellovibrionaceae bacterium]|nr:outer membrane beta-barrel protein [Pseudobdellovibrionaceae bacterium]